MSEELQAELTKLGTVQAYYYAKCVGRKSLKTQKRLSVFRVNVEGMLRFVRDALVRCILR